MASMTTLSVVKFTQIIRDMQYMADTSPLLPEQSKDRVNDQVKHNEVTAKYEGYTVDG